MRSAFDIVANVMVQGLDSIKDLTGEVKKLGSAADNTGDKLDGVGNKSKTTAKNVAPLRDRLQDLGTMFRDSGDAGGRFGDILDMVSVATTPTGLGIVALVGTFASAKIAVDAVTASLSLYIETNDEAAAAASRLKESTATLNESVIDLATGEGGLAAMLEASVILSDKAAAATDRLAKSTKESTAAFGENSLAAAALHTPLSLAAEMSRRAVIANEQLTQSNIGLASSFGGVVSAASSAASAIASAASSAASSFAVILGLQESATSATIRRGISALAQSPLGKTLGEAGVLTFPGQAPKFRGGGGGGKKGKSRAELLQEESGALVDEMMGDLLQDPAFLATLVPEAVVSPMLTAGLGAMDEAELQTKLAGYGAGIDDIRAKLEAANLEQTMFDTLVNDLAEAAGALGAQSFMNLGNSVAFAMGEMAAGTSTLSEFGDAMADLASRVAGDFGSLFVKMGAGFLVTPGMQGVGAGLIAAGLGLQVLSGFLGGKGSGNRGGGGRAGSASAARDIAREVTRSLRPSGEDGPMVTNIEVVIGGRSIQPEMVAIVDDIARQRRSRYLGRRMGV